MLYAQEVAVAEVHWVSQGRGGDPGSPSDPWEHLDQEKIAAVPVLASLAADTPAGDAIGD